MGDNPDTHTQIKAHFMSDWQTAIDAWDEITERYKKLREEDVVILEKLAATLKEI
jgi:hypothetical protein